MGNKIEARALAGELGVPTLPGSRKVATYDEAKTVVDEIGLPVMMSDVDVRIRESFERVFGETTPDTDGQAISASQA